jgi:hypothetical protein
MAQSQHGAPREAEAHLLTVVISIFIQLIMPLLPLKLMAQSGCGVNHFMEAHMHPLTTLIEPSALRAAKEDTFE